MNKQNNDMNIFASTAIRCVSCAVNDIHPLFIDISFDWNGFIKFCYAHKILNVVYYGLKRNNVVIPDNFRNIFEENMLHSMLKDAQRDVEIDNLSDEFEKNSIKHMIMKGHIIKKIYPESYLRSMSDVDILVGKDIERASDILIQNGFILKSKEFLHYSFKKENSFSIELHKSLVDESLETLYSYFKTGFEKAKKSEGFNYKYELSNEDFYIFLIAHLAKHYKICGTGIRSIIDVYLYNKTFTTLNWEYICNELKKIGLKDFESNIKELSYKWFSGDFNGNFDSVDDYIISGGVYGNIDNHELNKFILDESQNGKYKYLIRTVFPNKKYMCARYSFLKKAPVFIPIFWIIRIISTLFSKKESVRYRLKGVSGYSSEDEKRFRDVGLK